MRLADVDALHEVAGVWQGHRRLIDHPELEAFSQLAGRFSAALGETADEGYWAPVIRLMKRARWDAVTTPLRLSHPDTGLQEAARAAAPKLMRCRYVAPELATAAEDLAERLSALSASGDDPVGEAIRAVLAPEIAEHEAADEARRREYERTCAEAAAAATEESPVEPPPMPEAVPPPVLGVLLRSGRHAARVTEALADLSQPVAVLTPPEFIASRPLDLVVAAGPSAWFPPSTLRACRARRLVFVYPAWIKDADSQDRLLAGPAARTLRPRLAAAPRRTTVPFDSSLPVAPAEEWVPQADWRAISAAGRRRGADEAPSDPVAAWLFALASGEGVYLEATDGSRAYVVELQDEISVHQEPTSRIEQGDFVMLRTEGDGDYISVIADRILGAAAAPLRAKQAEWKSALAQELRSRGGRGLRQALEALGGTAVTDNNVRQWLRPDSIRTRDPANFSAILAVAGMRDRFSEFWDAMGAIDSAHRRAGMQVRSLLVAELVKADTATILGQGWADFDIDEIEGEGSLRVARVEGRAPDTQTVSRTRTRRPFPIARDLWPE